MLQSWLAKKLITFVMGRTRDGDIRPTLLLDAPDVELTFPGRNSGRIPGAQPAGAGRGLTAPLKFTVAAVDATGS